jgi:antitoxin component YwqK of YwqJK toxin-antitoxin module
MRNIVVAYAVILLILSGCSCSSCKRNSQNSEVLSQHYIHKYGYLVSKEEWEARNYPGQVVTSLSDGVTVTATYENGVLHGPMTFTFPHSQNVQTYHLFNWGDRVKEISYDTRGMPVQEKIQLNPSRYSLTAWYASGSPMSVEEFHDDQLLEGQYYTLSNEMEARVEKGRGMRIFRDGEGMLLSRESIESGYATKKETFYSSTTPESLALYSHGKLHGERKTFAPSGEPLSLEQWADGQLHGISSYFKNGTKYLEISYHTGEKNGLERHFIDGQTVSQEIVWEADMKHGPSTFFFDGKAEEQQWFYGGKPVSKRKFDELRELDGYVMQR